MTNTDFTARCIAGKALGDIAGKQDVLTTEQLTAVNSGITSTDVEQIAINENNISWCQKTVNSFDFATWSANVYVVRGTSQVSGNTISITSNNDTTDCFTGWNATEYPENARIPVVAGDVVTLTWDIDINTENIGKVWIFPNATATGSTNTDAINKVLSYTVPSGTTYLTLRFDVRAASTTISYSDIMLRYNDKAYQPYAMSNAELTAAIKAIQAQLANQ